MSASGFGPRTGRQAPSAMTGSGQYATHKTLIFSTEFYFLPEGVKDVFARFKKALQKSKLVSLFSSCCLLSPGVGPQIGVQRYKFVGASIGKITRRN